MHEQNSPSFFRSPDCRFSTRGVAALLPPGPLDSLAARAQAFFGAAPGLQILLGALPFDRRQPGHFIQPAAIFDFPRMAAQGAPVPPQGRWRVTAEPSARSYSAMVARALTEINAQPDLEKVVLARRLLVEADVPLDPLSVAARLGRDPTITAFALPLPEGPDGAPRTLVGGTPELLLAKSGRTIRSNPLAGSARRQADAMADKAAARALSQSEKNRREHALVVEAILDALAPYCEDLATPAVAAIQSTASMWHLGTRIEGRLRDKAISCAELLARLHPTPAVCGFPRDPARALIRDLEPFDRGYYAGAVGWIDGKGDGEWHIALRCGEISGRRATLYAGAGIVPGSDPVAEAEETSAKFLALLGALGIDENGVPLEREPV